MLWKTKSEVGVVGGGMASISLNGSSDCSGGGGNKNTRENGVVIFPFQNYKQNDSSAAGDVAQYFLQLELGEIVVVTDQPCPGWFFGWKKFNPEKCGLFPASHVAQPKREFSDLLGKIGEVCREWGEIRKKLFVDAHLYQFEHISRGIFELIEGRRALLNQSLTQDQYRELTRKLCSRIDWGNRKLGLDLIPWNWLLEDGDEDNVYKTEGSSTSKPSPNEKENSSKILPECNKHAGKLFKLHQKSVESAATRGSSTLSRPKNKKEQKNDLYLTLRDFSYSFTDDCEISFSLFDGKRFISERHIITQKHAQVPQSNFHIGNDDRPTIFREVNVANKRDLYLVVQIVRIGRMFYAENAGKKFSSAAKRRFRRPYACGVLSLNDVDTLNEDELEYTTGCCEKAIKLYTSDEKDFWQVHELIVSQNYKNIVSKIIPVLNSFSVSTFWCGANAFSSPPSASFSSSGSGSNQKNPISSKNSVSTTKLIGLHNLIAPPGVVRNDLYLTLSSVELLDKKANKTGGAKSCNLETEIQIIDSDDELLPGLGEGGNCWKSLILHHINCPKYNETIQFSIPIETFPKAKVRLLFRHCSTKDKTEPRLFGVTWLSLMDPSGTTVRDGDHPLQIYKWTDESSLPLQSSSLNLSKDSAILQTLMVSTKFTQNIDLVNLLKWKQTVDLKPSLQNLISSPQATEEIVRKFLADVLDALFTIFSDEDGNSTDHSGDVFTLLVNIFQLLRNSNYAAYKSVLNAYCGEHFAAALVYKGLLLSLNHYTAVLLNSVTAEDITTSIQNCYNSLQFIFKFIVQSQILFSKATGGHLEDSFRRDVKELIASFCKVFACTNCSPVFVETQGILLQNFAAVYEELLRVMPLMDVCQLVSDIYSAIPVKETSSHPLSPAKLSSIHQVVKSRLFRHSSCRALLLPVFCKHIRHHLAHREELKLCTDVLSEILIYLHDIRHVKEERAHADIEVVCTTTLEMLVQSVLVLERTSSIVGNLVTCLIHLLEQMDACHYNRLWDEFSERKPLRDLLSRVFILFRDLIKHEVFPSDWNFMKLLTCHVMASSQFCQPLVTDFLKFFDVQLWSQYFNLAVTFITQPGLQLETFREWKREWILEKYGDMRLTMGYQMLQLWTHLGDAEKRHFIPLMIGPFLEVTMIPQPELRVATLQTLFYDMMLTEYHLNGDIKETESELIDRLDLLVNSEQEIQHGDEEYRLQFREIHLKRLDSESRSQKLGNNWLSICSSSIESLSNLQQLLLDYRAISKEAIEENRDKLMQCTVNLLNFYREEKRVEQYLRYVYKLHDLHLSTENYTEAGFTLLLHGQLLGWDREKMLSESSPEPGGGVTFPRQREADRKEKIYLLVLKYFDQGKVWEKGIALCKELAHQYEITYDYTNLSRILQTQANFYENILNTHRPEPEYFKVAFLGQGFPTFVRNKEFIYRGAEYERLAAFIQRIAEEWPNAMLITKNAPPDPKILQGMTQYLQICNVKPKNLKVSSALAKIPERIRAFYLVNEVSSFQFDRRIEKEVVAAAAASGTGTGGGGAGDDGNNEFKSMWIERTTLQTAVEFPEILRFAEIVDRKTIVLSPVEFAGEKMEEANAQLQTLIAQYSPLDPEGGGSNNEFNKNVNPLSMRLQGMLDAAVMGGIPKYNEAFFNEEFLKNEDNASTFVLKLVGLLQDQVKLLESGLQIHEKLVPPGVQPLHKRLLECHSQMRSSVTESELLIHTTLASLNNATLRRSDSGVNIIHRERESFRKLGGGKSIVNSPLPPVPTYKTKLELKTASHLSGGGGSASNSNRSSISSSGGYGQIVMRMGSSARDHHFDHDDDDDDVYSQPVESNANHGPPQTTTSNGNKSSITAATTEPSYSKPPLIPSRLKKVSSLGSSSIGSGAAAAAGIVDTEYIVMPPSRLREMNAVVDGRNNSTSPTPPPIIPPKPSPGIGNGNNNSPRINSPPPPLLPRKPSIPTTGTTTAIIAKTLSITSLNSGSAEEQKQQSGSPPPPVPPKPNNNNSNNNGNIGNNGVVAVAVAEGDEDDQNNMNGADGTYMNKAELLAEMDSMNRNKSTKSPNGTSSKRPGSGGAQHKEYFVPPGAKDIPRLRDSSASN